MFSASRIAGKSRLPSSEPQISRHRSASVSILSRDRDSYGAGSRASSEERKSGNGSNRRWSGMRNSLSNNEAKGAIKETRPLNDKAYQKKKVLEIIEFLEVHNFKLQITPAKLMQPSKKDFELIFQFLVNFWDTNFEVKNLEEDAVRVLKNMRYPFIPNKSAFTYVARTNFSSLLGILIFLMDFAKFYINIDLSNLLSTGDGERPEEHAAFVDCTFKGYHSGESDDVINAVFEKIILSRVGDNLDELEEEKVAYDEKLKKVKVELEKLEKLHEDLQSQDARIMKYEKYFSEMQEHKEKKLATLSKLTEDFNQRMSELKDLQETLSDKQAVYDAQGFDGKKHFSHFEEQKRELNETLQKKKILLRELQDECWDLEMQHTKLFDKGAELCKNFNQTSIQIEDMWKTVISTLQSCKDPQVQDIAGKFKIDIPKDELQFNQQMFLDTRNIHRESVEEILKTVAKANIVLKTITSAKSQELTEIEMKKLHLSTKLKCATLQETKTKMDLDDQEKQIVEKIKDLDKTCEEYLEQLNNLRKRASEKLDLCTKLKSDLEVIEKVSNNKSTMLDTYVQQQKAFFKKLDKKYEEKVKEFEKMEEDYYATLKKITNNEDKAT